MIDKPFVKQTVMDQAVDTRPEIVPARQLVQVVIPVIVCANDRILPRCPGHRRDISIVLKLTGSHQWSVLVVQDQSRVGVQDLNYIKILQTSSLNHSKNRSFLSLNSP